VLGGAAGLHAQPTLEVRGRMRLELERVQRVGRGLAVTGVILDEALGEPMAGWTVALRLLREDELGRQSFVYGHAVPADLDGVFRFEVPNLSRARYLVQLSALGDERYAEPVPIDREIDLARRAIELRLFVPSEQPSTNPSLPVAIEAIALDRGSTSAADAPHEQDLPVELELDGRAIATLLLKDGRVSTALVLPPAAAGKELVLRAHFAGDETRGAAEASARVRLVEPATLRLQAEPSRAAGGADITLSGRLRFGPRATAGLPVIVRRVAAVDEDGSPIDGESIVVTTGEDGTFSTTLRAPSLGSRASFEAAFTTAEAKQRGLQPATSELVVVELTPRLSLEGVARRPAGTALVVTALLLLALLALRLLSALVRRRAARQTPSGELPTAASPRVGVAQRILGTLRISADRRVAGQVIESDRGRPLPGVRVQLQLEGAAEERITDEEGRFSFGELPSGPVELRFTRDAYVTTTRRGLLPHRGELAVLDIALLPLRARLLRLYGEALAPYLPGRDQLGPRTPRELESLVLARTTGPLFDRGALRSLRHVVEESCFGAAGAQPESLQRLEREVERLALGPVDPPSAPRPRR